MSHYCNICVAGLYWKQTNKNPILFSDFNHLIKNTSVYLSIIIDCDRTPHTSGNYFVCTLNSLAHN